MCLEKHLFLLGWLWTSLGTCISTLSYDISLEYSLNTYSTPWQDNVGKHYGWMRYQNTELRQLIIWPIYVKKSNAKSFWTAFHTVHLVNAKYFKSWVSQPSKLRVLYFRYCGLTSIILGTCMRLPMIDHIAIRRAWG